MQSVCIVELHAIVNYTQILSDAQQYFYGKFMSLATMQIICTRFWKKLYSNTQFSHITYKCKIVTKTVCLLMAFFRCIPGSSAKQIVMTYKSLHSFSDSILLWNIIRDQSELINCETICIKYYKCVCLYSCVSHPVCKVHLFYAALSHVAYLVLPFFLHYLINSIIFGKKSIEHNMCFDFLYNVCLQPFSY
jgi:ABC-type sugar transport system permease subunit